MGGGALEPKTVARVSKKAFTLAEVLITLAIIGVVAALTIPTVVANYQKKALYTQFMKVYNTLSQVTDLSQVENGDFGSWGSEICSEGDCVDISDKFIAPFLKIVKTCNDSNASECFPLDKMKGLNDEDASKEEADLYKEEFMGDTTRAYLLQDGSSVVVCEFSPNEDDPYLVFFVDTNGLREPNRIGRDIFQLRLTNDGFGPGDDYLAETTEVDMGSGRIDTNYANCNPSESNSSGIGCAARLLLEHEMKY